MHLTFLKNPALATLISLRIQGLLTCLLLFGLNNFSFGQTPKLVLPAGHASDISHYEFSRDSKYLLTFSFEEYTVKVWDVAQGKLLHDLNQHKGLIEVAGFSPNGEQILTSSMEDEVRIWNTKSGQLIKVFEGGLATFSPDGRFIALKVNSDYQILDAVSWRMVAVINANQKRRHRFFFSKDSQRLIDKADGYLRIWNISNGKLYRKIKGGDSEFDLAFFNEGNISPDTRSVVILKTDTLLSNVTSGQNSELWFLDDDTKHVNLRGTVQYPVMFSPDGKIVVTELSEFSDYDQDFISSTLVWSTQNGRKLLTIPGSPLAFNAMSDHVVTASDELNVWDIKAGKFSHALQGHRGSIDHLSFSRNGEYIIGISREDSTARFWNAENGYLIKNLSGDGRPITDCGFSPDGRFIVTIEGNVIRIWNTQTVEIIYTLKDRTGGNHDGKMFSDGKFLAINSVRSGLLSIVDAATGKLVYSWKGSTTNFDSWAISPNDKYLAAGGGDKIWIWEVDGGKLLHAIEGHAGRLSTIAFSTDGRMIISGGWDDHLVKTWDVASGELLFTLDNHQSAILTAAFSPNSEQILTTALYDSVARIWNVKTGELVLELSGHTKPIRSAIISPTGDLVATFSEDSSVKIWETRGGKLVRTLSGKSGIVTNGFFSRHDDMLISVDAGTKFWNTVNGLLLSEVGNEAAIILSPVGDKILTGQFNPYSNYADYRIREIKSGNEILSMKAFGYLADFDWKENIGLLVDYSKISLIDFDSKSELLSRYTIDENDWVVTHPSGLFDASPGAMSKLYFVINSDVIEFGQLKQRYFEPGLWKKVMAGEKLRDVVGFKSIVLPPDLRLGKVDDEGYLNIELINRGGGIGEVNLFVNGKEYIKDIRSAGFDPDVDRATFKVFIHGSRNLLKGEQNIISVRAWNKEHWIQGKGQYVSYQSEELEQYRPAIHIFTCGVSDYTGDQIDLNYAAKDALDMSLALKLGAKQLFGNDRIYLYNLTTSGVQHSFPTKENILKAFENISSTAHPLDIFIMYVSGHGINYGGQEGDWYYLTQDAYTSSAEAYIDPVIRARTTLSSSELVELFKKVPALKQVLILDACASGKVVDNFVVRRDIESSTLRALDRMRDRTGVHIITGCTADAVSYEASKFGQGILTYSLLEGIRGAALREDRYVDISKLFQYAQDRVPQLAQGIGGIQSPQVFSPEGSGSFDIGMLGADEKKVIPLAPIRPVYIQSNFQDELEMSDVLGLGKRVDQLLGDYSSKGSDAKIIFVPVREYPDGCQLVGRYSRSGGKIQLKVKKKCEGNDTMFTFIGRDLNELSIQMVNAFLN